MQKSNRSVVTNDEINENVKGLLNKFTQVLLVAITDDPQAYNHSTLAKTCGKFTCIEAPTKYLLTS